MQGILKSLLRADPAQRLTASRLVQLCQAKQEAPAPAPEVPAWQYNLSYEVHQPWRFQCLPPSWIWIISGTCLLACFQAPSSFLALTVSTLTVTSLTAEGMQDITPRASLHSGRWPSASEEALGQAVSNLSRLGLHAGRPCSAESKPSVLRSQVLHHGEPHLVPALAPLLRMWRFGPHTRETMLPMTWFPQPWRQLYFVSSGRMSVHEQHTKAACFPHRACEEPMESS